ncbi:MAG: hypothetical protein WBC85_16590, partial [Planktotalea sp.]|uniref:hypothetical protein n=1 Tax=Planktotalea sp. TaxID=2029877 RepID=UPI003C74BF89
MVLIVDTGTTGTVTLGATDDYLLTTGSTTTSTGTALDASAATDANLTVLGTLYGSSLGASIGADSELLIGVNGNVISSGNHALQIIGNG